MFPYFCTGCDSVCTLRAVCWGCICNARYVRAFLCVCARLWWGDDDGAVLGLSGDNRRSLHRGVRPSVCFACMMPDN